MSNIKEALQELHKTGGFTYSFITGELNPKKGFSLAVSKDTEKIIDNILRYKKTVVDNDVKKYAHSNIEELMKPNRFLGGWVDNNKLYLDVSEVVETRDEVVRLCKEREQLAYWDNEAGKAVFV